MHLAAMNRTGSQVLQLFRRFAESHKKENVSHGYLRLDMPPSHIENALHSSLEFAETSVNHVRIDSGHCIVDCRFQFHQSLGLLRISERLQKSRKKKKTRSVRSGNGAATPLDPAVRSTSREMSHPYRPARLGRNEVARRPAPPHFGLNEMRRK